MPWEPEFVDDGDAATAADINAIMTDAEAWVNDIGAAGIRRGAFNHFHPPGTGILPTTALFFASESTTVAAYNKLTFAGSITYTTFGANGGSSDAGDLGSGDRAVIGHVTARGIANPCMVVLPGSGYKVGMTQGDRVGAIVCFLNVEVRDFLKGGGIPTQQKVMTCLQFRLNGAGTWYTIDSSERFTSLWDRKLDHSSTQERVEIDMPTMAVITESMIDAVGDASVDRVTEVRGMCSMFGDTDGTSSFMLYQWFLTVLPIHCDISEV